MKNVLTNLINNLIKRGFVSQALDVYDILKELETDEADDASVSNIVGLRGETKPEEPIGGFTVSPQFFNSGDSF